MTTESLTCEVRRVTAPDTLAVEIVSPSAQCRHIIYVRLYGVDCEDAASQHILDWVELYGRTFDLLVLDWLRDRYGRVIGDLSDHGETLTEYLIKIGVAKKRERHHEEVIRDVLTAQEPET